MTLSTHVLDATTGRPADGVRTVWDSWSDGTWTPVATRETDGDGRISDWGATELGLGVHRLVFATGAWFAARRQRTFYPEVSVVFEVTDTAAHHHVPLLLSPFAYSTYRGS
ncbi:hydroxyisourate hydrolase [Cryptosporangium aurantiacum]|uniref:5-hydroxyisourate hydrolase n=1 Tax=Cryptosporangium aurantiacum TaxID=134849 RepID=A0A1M7QCL3_9ACTN|nr:hydroxyisourate hydrolase [Cryptosporangium aurantiacum]SHN28535.1 5-hydroxyisourate hydrolase [Cryptosporangium aurantiacum]